MELRVLFQYHCILKSNYGGTSSAFRSPLLSRLTEMTKLELTFNVTCKHKLWVFSWNTQEMQALIPTVLRDDVSGKTF